jgi:branched-chain amino acid transport system ATP-binding protein
MDATKPILELRGLTGGYGGRSILNGVDLSLRPGEIVCMIGHNGAGKSTVLKAIYGMLPERSGDIFFDGAPTLGLRPHQLLAAGLAFVPQNHTIFPKLTVGENLRMGGFLLRDDVVLGQRIDEVLALFPVLRERAAQWAASLSGGEQRMLEIARALITHPRLIMLDEPSIGLAPRMVDMVFDAIEVLRQRGLTVLMVEQNVRKALARADRACLLEQGAIRVDQPAAAMLADKNIGAMYLGGAA